MTTFGLLIFDGAEELDFVGPWEVFTASAMLQTEAGAAADTCVTVAERAGPVRCAKGLRVLPDHSIADHPPLDVLLVPGGVGAHRGGARCWRWRWPAALARTFPGPAAPGPRTQPGADTTRKLTRPMAVAAGGLRWKGR